MWREILDHDLRNAIENVMSSQSPNRALSSDSLRGLGILRLDSRQAVLVDSFLQVGPLTVSCILANFSYIPEGSQTFEGRLVYGAPIYGESELQGIYTDSLLLLQRGKVSFAQKALCAMRHGAKCLIVVQNEDYQWPFLMTDSAQELSVSSPIPVVMVSAGDAEMLLKTQHKLKSRSATLRLAAAAGERSACAVCQEPFRSADEVLKLPCRHCYHASCLAAWLQRQASCPLCRASVGASHGGAAAGEAAGGYIS
jgi:hypothetical protein